MEAVDGLLLAVIGADGELVLHSCRGPARVDRPVAVDAVAHAGLEGQAVGVSEIDADLAVAVQLVAYVVGGGLEARELMPTPMNGRRAAPGSANW